MEEVDKIIIHSLNSIGCDIDDEITSLKLFNTDMIVSTVVRCLKVINSDVDLPNTLPPGMSARFRMGASLANCVQDVGYTGELGYQTFLYSSETEIRKVLMFLIEKLPKEASHTSEEPLGASVLLQRAISAKVGQQILSPWTPPHLKDRGITWRGKPPVWQREGSSCMHNYHACHLCIPEGIAELTRKIPKDVKAYYCHSLPYVTNQTRRFQDTAPSVIEMNATEIAAHQESENEWNHSGLASRLSQKEFRAKKMDKIRRMISDRLRQDSHAADSSSDLDTMRDLQQVMSAISSQTKITTKTKGSRFAHTEKLLFKQDESKTMEQIGADIPTRDTEEEQQKKREEEVETLKKEMEELTSRLEALDMEMKKFTASQAQMAEQVLTETRKTQEKESNFRVKKQTLDLLPDAENNISKLQALVDASASRLVSLANQWEKHRAPLIEQYRELKSLNSMKESEAQKKLVEIKIFRARMKDVAADARNKEEIAKQLHSEYERITKDVNRSAYTKKIMEIVSNIKKQKQEIDKVLVDTREIQKEINLLSGKLDRTFIVADELIFKDAKKDESVKKAYRFLAALHENCDQLIKTVEETGVIMREIRDLEEQIEAEQSKKVLANLQKISEDFQQMKKENATMITKLKSK
ncbi:coiled-coil domain-containing protein 22 homolog [Gigantopelta aegis]|uniref:coiled-coil domain-containing protein 22 homolog n=1 Tax=Gigantopelta aegis TaxID=1735272 RepID=UPI001B88B596|nr:coiled-coil domain-containing protein 22 homolog [Gigantopelta aegis]